ncbi:uncharacterized protein B0I36DRAFT_310760 [Microdochium trichocladiopsis]|uniref:Uncharacterized protein n=1 Tax=Microdochium trichocladiopsis TaxID=1682393 RepID=A0A9P8YHG9_9PEZI|nr:uncharacterized protein B0I36DRAFT_310760 [Microdochium trichocladiopsis]KAH7040474.1 hypothetical protein B0I36DRAFT_310760 [Microdochium trichocladiopsis]
MPVLICAGPTIPLPGRASQEVSSSRRGNDQSSDPRLHSHANVYAPESSPALACS